MNIHEEVGVRYHFCDKTYYDPEWEVFRYKWVHTKTQRNGITYIAIHKGNASANFMKLVSHWNRIEKWFFAPC